MSKKTEDIVFALRPGTLEVDDIVLTSESGALPLAIRQFTLSDFSHAALCTKPDTLFEAVCDGVMRRSVFGTFASRAEWIRVLRPNRPVPPNKYGLRVADYAEALYGRGYSRLGAVASRFPVIRGPEDGSVFCSQVIAHAYLECDVILVPGKDPSQVYPGLLLKSPELMDVTEECVREIGSASDADLYNQVVDAANPELPGVEMRMNRRVFEAVQKELGGDLSAHVHSLTDLWMWLALGFSSEAVKRSDSTILTTLEQEGMFEWYDGFSAKVQADAAVFEVAAKQAELSGGQMTPEIETLLDYVSEIISAGETTLEARKNTAQEYDELAKRTGLETLARLSDTFRRQYEDGDRLHQAGTRLIRALRQMKPQAAR